MTRKITDRPLLSKGRHPKQPPRNAASRIEALASDGFSVRGVAARLNVAPDTFRRWLDEFPALQDAFDNGRENERWALHNMLYRQAMEKGNVIAALFLLKSRHGYREGDQAETANRIQFNFQLPGAMTMQEFDTLKVIDGNANNRDERVSTQSVIVARGS